jgi:Kef-type K+ transport system membrane component KefB
MKVKAAALVSSLGLIVVLLLVKLITKTIGVWPLTRLFRFGFREGTYTTLLMATGLTFGTISARFGLTDGFTDPSGVYRTYLNQERYSILATVVIGSAIVPIMIAQKFFGPDTEPVITVEVISRDRAAGEPGGEDAPAEQFSPGDLGEEL